MMMTPEMIWKMIIIWLTASSIKETRWKFIPERIRHPPIPPSSWTFHGWIVLHHVLKKMIINLKKKCAYPIRFDELYKLAVDGIDFECQEPNYDIRNYSCEKTACCSWFLCPWSILIARHLSILGIFLVNLVGRDIYLICIDSIGFWRLCWTSRCRYNIELNLSFDFAVDSQGYVNFFSKEQPDNVGCRKSLRPVLEIIDSFYNGRVYLPTRGCFYEAHKWLIITCEGHSDHYFIVQWTSRQ